MPNINLATALMRIRVAGAQKADQVLEKSKGKFAKFGSTVKSAAGQVPILGGALQQMLTPMGAATVAGTAFVGFLVSSVKHVIDLERNLRPMIQTVEPFCRVSARTHKGCRAAWVLRTA